MFTLRCTGFRVRGSGFRFRVWVQGPITAEKAHSQVVDGEVLEDSQPSLDAGDPHLARMLGPPLRESICIYTHTHVYLRMCIHIYIYVHMYTYIIICAYRIMNIIYIYIYTKTACCAYIT